jgi:DNA-directed RNA polymerase specialized sigma24 family protein
MLVLTDAQVVTLLRTPDNDLVEFMLSLSNLSRKEKEALDLCARQKLTREEAAEEMDRSVDAVQKWYRDGIKKVRKTLAGRWWTMRLALFHF